MAKKKPRGRRPRKRPAESVEVLEFSLDDILAEYRTQQAESLQFPAEQAPETETNNPEPEEVPDRGQKDTTVLKTEGEQKQTDSAEESDRESEEGRETDNAPEDLTPKGHPGIPDKHAAEEKEPELPEQQSYPAVDTSRKSLVPLSEIEGEDEEDDFYSGVSAEPEHTPPAEEGSSETEDEPDEGEEEHTDNNTGFFHRKTSRSSSSGVHPVRNSSGGLAGKLTGWIAAASLRSEEKKKQPPPEPEDPESEMEPRKAARYYAGQMPSIRLRALIAGAVCLLLVWITLAYGFGWPLPGGLEEKGRAAALVCLAGQITVMLLGLDIVTSGVMSVLRARPGAESLIVLAELAAIAETAAAAVTGNTDRGLPFTVISSLAVVFALWGAWFNGRGFYDSFMTCFHIKTPTVVTSQLIADTDEVGLISTRRSSAGFIRRTEEPGPAESLAGYSFMPMTCICLILSLILALGGKDPGAFFHIFALMTGLCASFGWLFSYPVLFARTARHLLYNGTAIAGWSGARQIGESRRLVLTDTDIFPEDTVEIVGIRVLNKSDAEQVISATGSMLAQAGTGTAAVFSELMRQQDAPARTVEDFTVGEGGAKGTVDGTEVRVGTGGFMHLSGVKIPDRLKENNALYTAINGELAGVFLLRYRPTAGVQRALYVLRRGHRQPLFAVRDFNIDPLSIQRQFDVSTEGFRFPTFPERYRIRIQEGDDTAPPAGITGQDGLEPLVDLYESGIALYRFGRICAWACPACAILGAVLAAVPCWTGSWAAVSAARILIYMLLWLIPGFICRIILKK